MKVTVGIPTKGRYDKLVLTLEALAFQTHQDMHIIIIDDSDNPTDLRDIPAYQNVFELFNAHGITFQLEYGQKKGQHISHQRIQEMAMTDWIWRIDDDEIPEPDVLHILLSDAVVGMNVGAVGGLVLSPNPAPVPDNAKSVITDPNQTIQWFRHPTQATYKRWITCTPPFCIGAGTRSSILF